MSTQAQPIPQRTFIFVANKAAVGDQVNKELDTLYSVLQGGVGDAHIATNANISGSKIAAGSIPSTALADFALQNGYGQIPIGGVISHWSNGTVPDGWQVCDGSQITDPLSPLNGLTIPNLTNLFERGTALANIRQTPVLGGEDSHTLTVGEMPSHSHTVNDPGHSHNLSQNAIFTVGGGQVAAVPFNGALGNAGTTPSGTNVTINSNGGGTAHNNIPAYFGMVKIMRIK